MNTRKTPPGRPRKCIHCREPIMESPNRYYCSISCFQSHDSSRKHLFDGDFTPLHLVDLPQPNAEEYQSLLLAQRNETQHPKADQVIDKYALLIRKARDNFSKASRKENYQPEDEFDEEIRLETEVNRLMLEHTLESNMEKTMKKSKTKPTKTVKGSEMKGNAPLVLTSNKGDHILIGGTIEVSILRANNGRCTLSIKAPSHISIDRSQRGKDA